MAKGGFRVLTPLSKAVEGMIRKISTTDTIEINVNLSLSHVLAEDVVAEIDVPPFDRAAMDGYAVKAKDTFGASLTNPTILRKIGRVEIGEKALISVGEGEAVEIATGAMMPANADAVVMVEYTREEGGDVYVFKPVTPGKNVSMRGEDVRKGDVVLKKFEIITPQDIGVLNSIGVEKVRVYRKPVVAVISTGNELVEVGGRLEEGKIYNSNNPMVCAALESEGFKAVSLGIARDVYDEIEIKLVEGLNYDAVIFTGGTSVGRRDLVPEIVERFGEVVVHGIAMKPGMPTGAGIVDGKPVFMLPGSPSAAFLSFYSIVLPVLHAMNGIRIIARRGEKVKGVLEGRIPSQTGVITHARVRWENGKIRPIRTTGSGILTSLIKANALLVVPENREGYEEGEVVEVTLIRHLTSPVVVE